eukprot:GEZU01012531.1.p2 GENE.GEZU01012531.1~~GEZU01012531.1.p2  ORF type:complete len:103 (-),score=18.64 GEZU01012531.1:498-806(-)
MGLSGSKEQRDTSSTKDEPSPPEPIEFPALSVPLDEDGFCVAFSLTEEGAIGKILDFYQQYGFVVVKDVISPEDCQSAVNELWTEIESTQWGCEGTPLVKRE